MGGQTVIRHTYTYNSNHGITSKKNALNETVTMTYKYPDKGVIEKVMDPTGTELIKQGSQPAGHVQTYTYDFKNSTFYVTDFNGVQKKKVTNEKGQLLLEEEVQTGAEPKTIRKIEYLPNRIEKHTDSVGNVTTMQRDEWRNITKVTDGEGNITSISYNSQKKPLTVTDPLGTVTRMDYDAKGNLTTLTQALGKPEQTITTYGYNGYGEVTSVTANGLTTSYTYNNGRVASVTDPRNNATVIEYDLMGNPTKITDPMGNIVTATYDLMGNPLVITDPNGKVTKNTYDVKGNMRTTTDPLGNITTFDYNYANKVASVTDGEGKVTTYEYDGMKRLSRITDAAGGLTSFTYESTGCASCGNIGGDLSALSDPKGQTTSYGYDKGLMVK
ncbi:MAG TPA: hypothetical protein DDX85_06305, partial [Nitrospiraceae bacterium]|nr:hypothetical protein [Nitrospiraceae bacterium]